MRAISQKAQRTFDKITAGLDHDGASRKIDNGNGTYMAVHVDRLHTVTAGTVYSLAHYYEQNGDLMADPDMTFLVAATDGRAYPITFRQDGGLPINQESVVWSDHGTITAVRPRMQRQQAMFAGQWLDNIRLQQRLGQRGAMNGRAVAV